MDYFQYLVYVVWTGDGEPSGDLLWRAICKYSTAMLAVSVGFLLAGPLVWRHPTFLHAFARRHGPRMMLIRYRFIKATLWCGWWMLKHEVQYLNNRFREANQSGDMMSDFEAIYGALDEYLTGGQHPVTFPVTPSPPGPHELEPQASRRRTKISV